MRIGCLGMVIVLTWVASAVSELAAQSAMSGIVREDSSGRPLPGVEVLLNGTDHRTTTNAAGRYLLAGLPAGRHEAIFRAVGHLPVRLPVLLVAGDTTRANATMIRSDVVLDPIEVVGENPRPRGIGLEAFEERRKMGFGRFVDSAEMRRSEHLRLADILQRHGVMIRDVGRGRSVALNSRMRNASGNPNCVMTVYLDGIMVGEGGRAGVSGLNLGNLDVRNMILPHQLVAAEIYMGAAQLPVQFSGARGACGAVVLWSRRAP